MGLLDFDVIDYLKTPNGQALASGLATYAATARRGTPINNIGRGLLGGLSSLYDQQAQAEAAKIKAMQMQQMQMQMEELKRRQQESIDQRAAIKNIIGTAPTQYQADTFDSTDTPPTGMMEGTGLLGGKITPQDLPARMMGIPGMEDEAFKALMPKQPKYGVVERYNAQGMPEKVIIDENNPFNAVPFGGAKAEKPEIRPVADKSGRFQDTAFDPMSGQEKYRLGSPYKKGPNASDISQNTNMKLETEENKEKGKSNINFYNEAKNSANVARKLNANASIMQKYTGVTGWGSGAKAAAASFFGAMGIKDAEKFATDAQVFNSQAKEVVLQKQLAQKGPQTESDAKRIEETGASLGNTPAANKFILDVAMAQNDRDIAYYNFLDSYWRKNRTLEGADAEWFAKDGATSLFDSNRLKKYGIPQPQNQGWSIRRK